jgi:hypothetical protein
MLFPADTKARDPFFCPELDQSTSSIRREYNCVNLPPSVLLYPGGWQLYNWNSS